MSRRFRLAALVLAGLCAACVSRPDGAETVDLASRSYGFIGDALAGRPGTPITVGASLVLPPRDRFAPPYPALVLLHDSLGQGSQEWFYAKALAGYGVASLAIDSFSARGVSSTIRDQTSVSAASVIADAFAGLDRLAADRRIDPGRIGVMGFSKGAIAALYAAYRPIEKSLASPSHAFVLHIAHYPWCGLMLRDPETTGAPVLIQTGALDDVVPPERCRALAAASRGPRGPADIRLVVYPGARHGFDNPLLAWLDKLPLSRPTPAGCLIEQTADGGFRERATGKTVDRESQRAVLALCSRDGTAGGNRDAAARALARVLAFLAERDFVAVPPHDQRPKVSGRARSGSR